VRVDHHPGGGAQLETYKRCLLRYRSKPIWAAFIDNDEFIILRNHTSIKHLLQDVKPNGGSLYLNWIIFGTNGHQYYTNELVLKRFIERTPIVSEWGKSISFLPDVDEIRPHEGLLRESDPVHEVSIVLDVLNIYIRFRTLPSETGEESSSVSLTYI